MKGKWCQCVVGVGWSGMLVDPCSVTWPAANIVGFTPIILPSFYSHYLSNVSPTPDLNSLTITLTSSRTPSRKYLNTKKRPFVTVSLHIVTKAMKIISFYLLQENKTDKPFVAGKDIRKMYKMFILFNNISYAWDELS